MEAMGKAMAHQPVISVRGEAVTPAHSAPKTSALILDRSATDDRGQAEHGEYWCDKTGQAFCACFGPALRVLFGPGSGEFSVTRPLSRRLRAMADGRDRQRAAPITPPVVGIAGRHLADHAGLPGPRHPGQQPRFAATSLRPGDVRRTENIRICTATVTTNGNWPSAANGRSRALPCSSLCGSAVCRPGRRRAGPDMTAPPGACAHEGVPWPVRRSPHGEKRIMAPAGRYSMKAVVRARGTLTHRPEIGTRGRPALFQRRADTSIRPAVPSAPPDRCRWPRLQSLWLKFPGRRQPDPPTGLASMGFELAVADPGSVWLRKVELARTN